MSDTIYVVIQQEKTMFDDLRCAGVITATTDKTLAKTIADKFAHLDATIVECSDAEKFLKEAYSVTFHEGKLVTAIRLSCDPEAYKGGCRTCNESITTFVLVDNPEQVISKAQQQCEQYEKERARSKEE